MTNQQKTGQKGELMARDYFSSREYEILHTNWRNGHLEIDIIASKKDTLHFIEVKTLLDRSVGFPEESVNRKKLMNMIKAAERYMICENKRGKIQFDILAVVLKQEYHEFFLLEDVYL